MSISIKVRDDLKQIPSVDTIIEKYRSQLNFAPYDLYVKTIRNVLDEVRSDIQREMIIENIYEYTMQKILEAISLVSRSNLVEVINGTGIILHTGLGRAPLSKRLVNESLSRVINYSNLELNLVTGKRGERNNHVNTLLNSITKAEESLIVNNNAAAVLLMLNTIGEGKEVVISRGEQVEIGGSFRIPDVITKSGCHMVEVGTTNKTHLKDYENAITSNTGAILVAHTSNYKVVGFTESVSLNELSKLTRKKRIPLLLDLGCGVIADFKKLNLPDELSVQSYVKSGADVVSFSGDKLMGGPQAGILCGKKKYINKIHKNPLYRALRTDKFTFSLLESILRTYLTPTEIKSENLSLKLFRRNQKSLLKLGSEIINTLPSKAISSFGIEVVSTEVESGSGSLPLKKLPSAAIRFSGKVKASELSRLFRNAEIPVLGYIKHNKFYIDLKALPPSQKKYLIQTLKNILV